MKIRLATAIALALFAAVLTRADDYTFKAPFTRTGPFNATGEITLENVNGHIAIRTWDKNEILIAGEKSAKTEEELKLIDLAIDLSDSHAAIKVKLPKRSGSFGNNIRAAVSFTLTVPATVTLANIASVNSSIAVDGVRGPVALRSVNGGIRATGLAANTAIHTVNGAIHAAFEKIAASQQLSFDSVNGQIVVSLPPDAGADFSASTVNGRIDCTFPLTLADKGRRTLHGTIGDGRASLKVKTVNGGIHVNGL